MFNGMRRKQHGFAGLLNVQPDIIEPNWVGYFVVNNNNTNSTRLAALSPSLGAIQRIRASSVVSR